MLTKAEVLAFQIWKKIERMSHLWRHDTPGAFSRHTLDQFMKALLQLLGIRATASPLYLSPWGQIRYSLTRRGLSLLLAL